jgi:hypothetical protein
MKKSILGMALVCLLGGVQAFAAVVDTFECKASLSDLTSGKTVSVAQLVDSARKPMNSSPGPEYRATSGSVSDTLNLEDEKGILSVHFSLDYQHLIREQNGSLQAAQSTCLGIGSSYCTKAAPGNPARPCFDIIGMCGTTMPIGGDSDPMSGMTPVPVVDQVPAFNAQQPFSETGTISDNRGKPVGTYKVDCTYKGTLD